MIHRKALKEIRNLPSRDRERLLEAIRNLSSSPFVGDVKPVKGVKGVFRLRIGDYRLSYTINFEKIEIAILKVGRREAFYEGL